MGRDIRGSIFLKYFTKGNERTLRAKKNIIISFLCRALSLAIGFIIVPLTLGYIGEVEYGLWLTISSVISWFSFFDIGLGNGLRNKLAEALAKNDLETASVYISSSYALIGIIAIVLFIGLLVSSIFVSWNSVLNTDIMANNELAIIFVTVFFFFCIGFVLKTLSSVLQAMQQYAVNDILGVLTQIFGIIVVYILVKTTDGSLLKLCIAFGSKTAVVLSFASLYLYSGKLKHLRPKLSNVNVKRALPMMNLGIWFFINQILYLVVTQTSIILVVQFFGPAEVTVFNLSKRYMTIGSMLYIMVLTPFLSAFTEAYVKKEFSWIKGTIKKINVIWGGLVIGTIVLMFGYKLFFHYWVGDEIVIPVELIILMGVSSMIGTLSSTYTLFLNGIGKIRLQFYVQLVQAIVFIPLVYFLYNLNFGLSSLVIPGILFAVISSVLFIKQYRSIIENNAGGIWNK